MIFLSNRRGKSKLLGLQGDATSPKFSCLVGHSDLSMRKTLRLVGLLTVTIFFRSKKLTACKIKDEKDEIFFYFLVFNLLKIVHLFESKKHLRTQWNLIATHKNIWYVTNRFKYKFFSVITQISVTVTLVLLLKTYYIFYWNKRWKFWQHLFLIS